MISHAQYQFLVDAKVAASLAKHPWPGAAAAEGAIESWGQSVSAKQYNNFLGIKPPSWWTGETFFKLTMEMLKTGHKPPTSWKDAVFKYHDPKGRGDWWQYDAEWASFPTMQACFDCQLAILHRDADYAPALAATTPEDYIVKESAVWSTGPDRGATVLLIFRSHQDVLGPSTTSQETAK